MKLFGSLTELITLIFRKNSQTITVRPSNGTTYTAARTIDLPAQDANSQLISRDSTDTLTNKSISGSTNTLTNIPLASAITGILPTANGGTGQNSTATFPTAGSVAVVPSAGVVRSNGTSLTTGSVALGSEVTGILSPILGGTGVNNGGFFTYNNNITLNTGGATTITLPVTGTLATLAGVESLTNKSLNTPSLDRPAITNYAQLTEIATPSTPAAGILNLYAKSDDKLYIKNSAGTELVVGSGSGSGNKNYLSSIVTSNGTNNGNGDFELGNTTGWSLAHSTLSGTLFPTSVGSSGNTFSSAGGSHGGSAASGTLSFAINTVNRLAGNYSAALTSSGASTAGDMLISDGFMIDKEDYNRVLTVSFAYSVSSGTLNLSGTSANSFAVYIYNAASNAWIQPAGVYNMVQSNGTGICTATFQTAVSAQPWQVAIVNVNATAGAYSLIVDDFKVGPNSVAIGAAISDAVAYTPTFTGVGSPTIDKIIYSRVGQFLHLTGSFTVGTLSGAVNPTMSLPSGLNIDTTLINTTRVFKLGEFSQLLSATNGLSGSTIYGNLTYKSDEGTNVLSFTTQGVGFQYDGGVANALISSGARLTFTARVPISGWSSNSVVSSDTDTRVVAARYRANSSPTLTNAVFTTVAATTKDFDTHSAYNTGTGAYTIPVSGKYAVGGTFRTSAFNASASVIVSVLKNGTSVGNNAVPTIAGTANNWTGEIYTLLDCAAGDTISFQVFQNSGANQTLDTNADYSFIEFSRLSGSATIQATETVAARAYSSATSISSSLATVSWATTDYDTHGALSGGTYTVPISGKYHVNSALLITGTIALNNNLVLEIQKNGTVVSRFTEFFPATLTDGKAILSDIIQCVAGDTLRIQVSTTATAPSIVSSNFDNYLSLSRIGN